MSAHGPDTAPEAPDVRKPPKGRARDEAPLALMAEFPEATRDQWRELVSAVLAKSGVDADADPEAALASRTYDGIVISPLYTAADAASLHHDGLPGHPPFVRGATAQGAAAAGWDVRQRHGDPDAAAANSAILTDLTNGATSLWLVLGDAGLAVADLAKALDSVHLDLAPVVLDAGPETRAAAHALLALARQRGVADEEVRGTLGADPVGLHARTGAQLDLRVLTELAAQTATLPNLRVAAVDATVYHDAGASDSDEVAVATATGVAYLRELTEAGSAVDEALDAIEFRFAVTQDQFLSIAKLRAARRVWDRVAQLSGAGPGRRGQLQHAVTSAAMMTRRDPWVNMLRTTIGCFAAAVGGAGAITVLPFDAALGLPDDFARRIARNTQAILHDESSLARVIDPAGGSWYIETLTDQLAERAWTSFTRIEQCGGVVAALGDGTIDAMIGTTRAARADDIAHRRSTITGVSEFALPDEKPVRRRPAPAVRGGGAMPVIRYAQEFEALRDRAEAATTDAGRPRIFLAAIGPATAHSARVSFASNVFQAAGIEPIVGAGNPAEIVSAFGESGASVVCLCSSDSVYETAAGWASEALCEAGADVVWLAGRPGGRAESDRAAGITGYLFAGCDVLDVLARTLDGMGVK